MLILVIIQLSRGKKKSLFLFVATNDNIDLQRQLLDPLEYTNW